jgi:ATP-dependent Clp endopeptidase proteolytic subunit ClpP
MNPKGYRPMRSTRRPANMGKRPEWFTIRNGTEVGAPTQVHIYDEIGFWGVTASEFVGELMKSEGDIEMHLNSPGGDIFDGVAIYNALKQRSGLVKVIVDGLAASAASFIAQAATEGMLFMAPHSQMMIHDGFAMAIGNAADLRETAELLDKTSDNIASIYAERSGRDADYWRERMRAETWYSDQEAVDAGLADGIHGVAGATAGWDLSIFNHARLRGASSHPPYTGTHTHGHPAFGHAEDGSDTHDHEHTHQGDSDHDHHEPDGDADDNATNLNQLILNAAVDESAWDGDAAMKAAGDKEDPAKAYASICAGRREGPSNERGSWALPHHKAPGDAPNAAGVRNALARLSSTSGLTNEDAARAHLNAHMKVINPDWEPDDSVGIDVLMNEVREALNA